MADLILNDSQAAAVRGGGIPIVVRDAKGDVLGVLNPKDPTEFTDEEISAAKQALASNRPGLTIDQVFENLKALERR